MPQLRHITAVRIAFEIVKSGQYRSSKSVGSYDGGMNFLGVLGEYLLNDVAQAISYLRKSAVRERVTGIWTEIEAEAN